MNCKNCSKTLSLSTNFCSDCGAKVIRNRLTIKNLFEHFIENYLNYDNKFIQTFIKLLISPEIVISSFVNGTRKKFINPVSFLAISFTVSGVYLFFFQQKLKEYMDFSNISATYGEGQQKLSAAIFDISFNYNSLLYLFIIPILALISWAVFYNKKYNFTEHVVIYLYSMSFLSILSTVLTVLIILLSPENYMILSVLILALMLIYHIFLLKRLFKLSVIQMFLKTLFFLPLFFTFYLVSSVVMVVIILLSGEVSLGDLVPKK